MRLCGSINMKTQDGPLCVADGPGARTTALDHMWFIVKLWLHGCSDNTVRQGPAQTIATKAANPPGRDFVNALSASETAGMGDYEGRPGHVGPLLRGWKTLLLQKHTLA